MKRIPSFLIASLLAVLSAGMAAAQKAPIASPGQVPSRIILTWAGDPAHTQAVTWRTEELLQTPQAQVARLSSNPKPETLATTVQGKVQSDEVGAKTVGHYSVQMDGLEAGTKYCYRVGNGASWSEWNVFTTASDKNQPFRFIYLGDAQNSIKSLWSRSIREANAAAPDARFTVFAGDLLAEGNDDRLWGEFTDALSFISARTPLMPVPGNHDLHRAPGKPDSKQVFAATPLWAHHFTLPANGPAVPELASQSYFTDYQGVRFIALDANVFANEDFEPAARKEVWARQVEWVESVLKNNPNHWTIVVQHQCIYAMASGREYKQMRDSLAPLYEKYGVDLVLQGHDHLYARSHKIANEKIVAASAPGVIYAISVSGPKMYKADETNRKYMAVVKEQKQLYQVIDVSPERLLYKARGLDGKVEDEFELIKKGKVSTFVDRAPRL